MKRNSTAVAVWALIAVQVLSLMNLNAVFCQTFRCDEGPPGRYCTEDLSGYHICEVVATSNQTSAITDTLVHCDVGKRCSCHFGPKCPPNIEPCSVYCHPPIFDYSFTLRYHGFIKDIAPPGVNVRYTQGLWYQHYSGRQSRISFTDWEDENRRQLLIVPTAEGKWIQYTANEVQCTNASLIDFPLFKVPKDYNADGEETIYGVKAARWKRIIGGRTTGSPVKIQYMYTRYDNELHVTRPVRIHNIQTGLRHTQIVNKTVGLFFAEVAPFSMDLFRKPQNC